MNTLDVQERPPEATVLIVDDDAGVREAVLAMLEREDRRFVVCSDAASAELALREFSFTHVVSDLQLSSLPFEGVTFVDLVRRLLPDSRIVVITGYSSPIVKSTALAVGADAFLSKPFGVADITGALRLLPAGDGEQPGDGALRVSEIEGILSGAVTAKFQPIVDLFSATSAVHAFEALARVPAGWPFRDMSTLFEYARRVERSPEVNAKCLERALCEGAALTDPALLFVNISPDAMGSPCVLAAVEEGIATRLLDPARLVVELTESAGAYDTAEMLAGIERLRKQGIAFAIDDTDKAAGNLRLIEQIRPAYMKLGHETGASFHADPEKTAVVRRVVALANALSAEVVLEGIDSHETLLHARRLGIRYGQGFWLGRPMDAAAAAVYRGPEGRDVPLMVH